MRVQRACVGVVEDGERSIFLDGKDRHDFFWKGGLNEIEAEWLAGFNFSFFITLTYRYGTKSKAKVKRDLHGLYRRVSQKVFGRNAFAKFPHENSLKFVPVIEEHASGELHVHMLVKDVDRSSPHVKGVLGFLPGLILDVWRGIAKNPTSLDVKVISSTDDLLNFCGYSLKQQGRDRENTILDYVYKGDRI